MRECVESKEARAKLIIDIANNWITFIVTMIQMFANITTVSTILYILLSVLENVTDREQMEGTMSCFMEPRMEHMEEGRSVLSLMVIKLLLLNSGDVETNPGPQTHTLADMESYKIGPSTGREVGLALIINIKEFPGSPKMRREGSEKDIKNVKRDQHFTFDI